MSIKPKTLARTILRVGTTGVILHQVLGGWSVPIVILLEAFRQRQQLAKQQDRFWTQLLPPGISPLKHEVVYGDSRSGMIDALRGDDVSLTAQRTLFKALSPTIAHFAEAAASAIDPIRYLGNYAAESDPAPTLHSFLSAIGGQKFRFSNKIPRYKAPILVPVGGAISNDLSADHIVATAAARRYHIVARLVESGRIIPLVNRDAIKEVRSLKDAVIEKFGPGECAEQIFDKQLRYEIWEAENIGAKLKPEPLFQPHINKVPRTIRDGVLLTVSRTNADAKQWVVSAQSLHQLGLASIDIFFRPELFLGSYAPRFLSEANEAIEQSKGVGFEAVLEIARDSRSQNETPRLFSGSPELGNIRVAVVKPPSPVFSSEEIELT